MGQIWRQKSASFRAEALGLIAGAARAPAIPQAVKIALCAFATAEEAPTLAGLGGAWRLIARADGPAGYDGAALAHPASQTLLLLNRGTEFPASVPDFLETAIAELAHADFGQMAAALDFAESAYTKAPLATVLCLGHSMGGGLAQAQAALLASALAKAGRPAPGGITAFGLASVGYAPTIRAFAAGRGLSLSPTIAVDAKTISRRADLVERLGLTDRLGATHYRAAIWQPGVLADFGKPALSVWGPVTDALHNHDALTYLAFRSAGPDKHVFWRWPRSRAYEVRPGAKPGPYAQGRLPAGDK